MLTIVSGDPRVLLSLGTTAQVRGRVTDSTGAVVDAAQITVTNINTNVQTKTSSNQQGAFRRCTPGRTACRPTAALVEGWQVSAIL
ncbi:MAG TPA: carboxypeptidase-like regulatory domain-containing protein [Bryobacteraceae bacterium]|jgi:hypothetical protein|nr:carboxypeptidase-like regulatory domain-containing protein [Bryobacteraceae bacterium]